MKQQIKYYIFRCGWNGTNGDRIKIVGLPKEYSLEEVEDELNDWVHVISDHVSERTISYSMDEIKILTNAQWQREWKKKCKEKNDIMDQWEVLRQMRFVNNKK